MVRTGRAEVEVYFLTTELSLDAQGLNANNS